MKAPPYFPVYPSDFLSDERFAFLEVDEMGAVFLLLMWQWQNGDIPDSRPRIAMICRSNKEVISKLYPAIKSAFSEQCGEGVIRNRWLHGEREKLLTKRAHQSNGGRAGMLSRWASHKLVNKQVITTDTDTDTETDTKEKRATPPSASLLPFEEIISDLNQKAGTSYKVGKAVRESISARFSEGFTLADFIAVHRKKCSEWLGTKMAPNLRPSTLYRPSHFGEYLAAPECKPTPNTNRSAGWDAQRTAQVAALIIPEV